MPRPRSFSEDVSLDRVLDVFWSAGFDGASMQALVEASGVHRGSLYATFGNKAELYHAALQRYADWGLTELRRLFAGERSVRKAVEKLLDQVATDSGRGTRGCFMVNATTERAATDPEVQQIAREHFVAAAVVLEQALRAAQERGELGPQVDAKGTAELLLATVQGMRVLGKAGTERTRLKRIARAALQALD
jgi:TetR/AcrR family transcriptional repressor of nem operon